MIVIDASAAVAMILGRESGAALALRAFGSDDAPVAAPAVIDLEVTHALRRLARDHGLGAVEAKEAFDAYRQMPIRTLDHRQLLGRIWSLRHHVTAYDAAYLALAEALDATLITCDRKLANAHGHTAKVEVYA